MLDTAYYYANGKCEEILGEILPTLSRPVKIATKANPWFANDFTCGKYGQLAREPLTNQLLGSLSRLQQENVDAFFLHCPDPETPLKETLDTCDELWRRERFDRFGVSNFSVGQLAEILEICETEKFNAPVIYQGMYNLVARKVEGIFPLIREHGIDFWAYNPLAGGLLTGKYAMDTDDDCIGKLHSESSTGIGKLHSESSTGTRFHGNSIYQNIFWKPAILQTLYTDFYYENQTHEKKSEKKCITDAFQWLKSKLMLDKSEIVESGDRIIIGASTKEQLLENMNAIIDNDLIDYSHLENIFSKIGEPSPNYFY
jgi:aflatoxin B1 aldehyde reductase